MALIAQISACRSTGRTILSRASTQSAACGRCAPNTGNLYKTSLSHANGKLVYIPLVDCIADMQVVYGWDMRNGGASGTDGLIDTYSNADGTTAVGAGAADIPAAVGDAAVIRNNLKLIKILLLDDWSEGSGLSQPGFF